MGEANVAGPGEAVRAGPRVRSLLGLEPPWIRNFDDPSRELRRLFGELFGTFLLVMVAAGGGVIDASTHGAIGRAAAVTSPALMVMAIILSMGAISGAHLNPVVSMAFALRREFPWRRVPGYVLAQLAGAVLACVFLRAMFGTVGLLGATVPGPGFGGVRAMLLEAALTLGLVSTILGTASGAQNVGPLSAIAVGGYIALAGLWSSPLTGASMNPARSFGPDLVTGSFPQFWVYLAGPAAGAFSRWGWPSCCGDGAATSRRRGPPRARWTRRLGHPVDRGHRMSPKEHWKAEPDEHDFPAAAPYLSPTAQSTGAQGT